MPPPAHTGPMSLEESLYRRRSMREFSTRTLSEQQIAQLLWAAQGTTDPSGLRTAPSAGALYGLAIYVVTREGLYRYAPETHRLETQSTEDLRRILYRAAMEQEAVLGAAAVFVIAAIYTRLASKYSEERSVRFTHLEAGHAAQNLLLQAVALGLASVPIGAFCDEEVHQALSLPAEETPFYLIPVGVRR